MLTASVGKNPVPYIASQPDPKTFVVELRDVVAVGFQNDFSADPRNPIAALQVEHAAATDGTIVARVRMMLDQPMRPRVRSSKNVIYVEAERAAVAPTPVAAPAASPAPTASPAPAAAAAVAPPTSVVTPVSAPVEPAVSLRGPSPAIRDVRVQKRGNATAVSLLGTSRLIATSINEPKDGPRRVVVNLPNVTSAVPNTTNVGQGPVQRVRIGFDPSAPLMTQVSIDLSRSAPYRVEASQDGNDLTLVFDEPAADPFSALQSRDSVKQDPKVVASTATSAVSNVESVPSSRTAAPAVPPVQQRVAAQAAPPSQPAVAQPVPTQPQPVVPAQQARYTGNPVSLDFQGADLRAVLRTFSEISGLNLVIDPSIQ